MKSMGAKISQEHFENMEEVLDLFLNLQIGKKAMETALSKHGEWEFDDNQFQDGAAVFLKTRSSLEQPIGLYFGFKISINANGWEEGIEVSDGEMEMVTRNAMAEIEINYAQVMLEGLFPEDMDCDVDLPGVSSKEIVRLDRKMTSGGFEKWIISRVVSAAERVLMAAREEIARNPGHLNYAKSRIDEEWNRVFDVLYNGESRNFPGGRAAIAGFKEKMERIVRTRVLFRR